ncbi:hypothetical protein H072_7993 [Dactylellina haptotyla CBS 200.50]|uniref:Uncharacterized protein n=1 Tax=Dactylellina haptotyla (strain CBS 200.50) TaxID=1284197 RepID=S8A691_DACHA|nr:hypothetical protein H072_7993 [Dactylellina haptotyla CBS 200.50]
MRFQFLTFTLLMLFTAVTDSSQPAENITVTLFEALPEVSEIAEHSTVQAGIKQYTTNGASIVWAINAKKAFNAYATATYDNNFYIDITSYATESRQLLTYYTGEPAHMTKYAEADCKITGTTFALCQITTAPAPGVTDKPMPTLKIFNSTSLPFYTYRFDGVVANSSGVRVLVNMLPAVVVMVVAGALMLL